MQATIRRLTQATHVLIQRLVEVIQPVAQWVERFFPGADIVHWRTPKRLLKVREARPGVILRHIVWRNAVKVKEFVPGIVRIEEGRHH